MVNAGKGQRKSSPKRSTWKNASAIVVGTIMGTGVLGLPGAFRNLGWILGTLSVVGFAYSGLYSGLLLSRTYTLYPHCVSYADVAREVVGHRFGILTEILILTSWAAVLPYFLVSAASTLNMAFASSEWCFYTWTAVVCCLVMLPLQFRSLTSVANFALLSDLTVILALLIIVYTIATEDRPYFRQDDIDKSKTSVRFQNYFFYLIFFSYEIPYLTFFFTKKKYFFTICIRRFFIVCICLPSTITYTSLGGNTTGFLPDSLPHDAHTTRMVVGVLLLYHICVSFIITAIPFVSKIHSRLYPEKSQNRSICKEWLYITSILIFCCFLVANLIPFFAAFQEIVGALLGAPTMFGWPVLFYLRAASLNHIKISTFDKIMCGIFFFVLMPTCTILGFTAAMRVLISNWSTYGKPFD
eukprot:GSMAST32.ASY1.ANO1.294.1 assembled CDS